MVTLIDLWLPILLSAVFIFIASSIIHMVVQWHNADCRKLSGEDRILAAMRGADLKTGEYMFPHCESMQAMGSAEMVARYKQGPVGFMTILPSGPPAMGRSLLLWFLYTILIGAFVGYIARLSFGTGAEYMAVFRLTSTVAILAYGITYIPHSIWKGTSWFSTFKFFIDGVVYGLLTAGTFGWLWPGA